MSESAKDSMGGGLYTPEQKKRRDETVWTLVQGVLAPLQFLVFAISTVFVINFLLNGTGLEVATASVILKTLILYSIMVTGAIWEKVVFGRYLFAPAFFWEDVVSMGVIALHTLYLLMWLTGSGSPQEQMVVALAAYGAYLVNAIQFLLKFQQARSSASEMSRQIDYDDLSYREGARS
ncbi:MAG: 2-vinyl bacteriochlorophyllide hydratase [Proteobacteria bacterium]|nr:MAG: 2-vinyl bacteriochlorophyllide hydratase [Pseudomonadota bacterium]